MQKRKDIPLEIDPLIRDHWVQMKKQEKVPPEDWIYFEYDEKDENRLIFKCKGTGALDAGSKNFVHSIGFLLVHQYSEIPVSVMFPFHMLVSYVPVSFSEDWRLRFQRCRCCWHIDSISSFLNLQDFFSYECCNLGKLNSSSILEAIERKNKDDELVKQINTKSKKKNAMTTSRTYQLISYKNHNFTFYTTRILHESYLNKEGGGRYSYSVTRRWFVLTADMVMNYYDEMYRLKGTFSIMGAVCGRGFPVSSTKKKSIIASFLSKKRKDKVSGKSKVYKLTDNSNPKELYCCMYVKIPKRTYLLQAKDPSTIDLWLSCFTLIGCARKDYFEADPSTLYPDMYKDRTKTSDTFSGVKMFEELEEERKLQDKHVFEEREKEKRKLEEIKKLEEEKKMEEENKIKSLNNVNIVDENKENSSINNEENEKSIEVGSESIENNNSPKKSENENNLGSIEKEAVEEEKEKDSILDTSEIPILLTGSETEKNEKKKEEEEEEKDLDINNTSTISISTLTTTTASPQNINTEINTEIEINELETSKNMEIKMKPVTPPGKKWKKKKRMVIDMGFDEELIKKKTKPFALTLNPGLLQSSQRKVFEDLRNRMKMKKKSYQQSTIPINLKRLGGIESLRNSDDDKNMLDEELQPLDISRNIGNDKEEKKRLRREQRAKEREEKIRKMRKNYEYYGVSNSESEKEEEEGEESEATNEPTLDDEINFLENMDFDDYGSKKNTEKNGKKEDTEEDVVVMNTGTSIIGLKPLGMKNCGSKRSVSSSPRRTRPGKKVLKEEEIKYQMSHSLQLLEKKRIKDKLYEERMRVEKELKRKEMEEKRRIEEEERRRREEEEKRMEEIEKARKKKEEEEEESDESEFEEEEKLILKEEITEFEGDVVVDQEESDSEEEEDMNEIMKERERKRTEAMERMKRVEEKRRIAEEERKKIEEIQREKERKIEENLEKERRMKEEEERKRKEEIRKKELEERAERERQIEIAMQRLKEEEMKRKLALEQKATEVEDDIFDDF